MAVSFGIRENAQRVVVWNVIFISFTIKEICYFATSIP